MLPGPPDDQAVLNALYGANFEGTAKLKLSPSSDVPEANSEAREALARKISRLKAGRSEGTALVLPLIGPAGSGKTHMLTWLRGEARGSGGFFVAADLTTASNDLFLTLNRAALDSLTRPSDGERPQLGLLLDNLTRAAGLSPSGGGQGVRLPPAKVASAAESVRAGLMRTHLSEALRFREVIGAVFRLASEDTDDIDGANAFFNAPKPGSLEAFMGLTWLMSLGSFTVLAMDQLDAIVTAQRSVNANRTREELISDLGIDLASIHEHAFRTFPVLTLLGDAWQHMKENVIDSYMDRFDFPLLLSGLAGELLEKVVTLRLDKAYGEIGFVPEYPSWPFPSEFFNARADKFPRDVLKECRKHFDLCYKLKKIVAWRPGLVQPPPPESPPDGHGPENGILGEMDAFFGEASGASPPVKSQSFWDEAIPAYLECLALEDPAAETAGLTVDSGPGALPFGSYTTATTSPPAPELVLTVVTALGPHGSRYCSILDDARLRSGIQKDLPERSLAVIRPDGSKPTANTKSLRAYDTLAAAGGRIVAPTRKDETQLHALTEVRARFPDTFTEWARSRRPAGRIGLLKKETDWLLAAAKAVPGPQPVPAPPPAEGPLPEPPEGPRPDRPLPPSTPETAGVPARDGFVRAGTLASGWKDLSGGPALMPLKDFREHVAILGQSGSGKTVLLRRLVEEAALQGVSSLVIDCSGDLTLLGQPWPRRPESFTADDDAKARAYFADVDAVVWTPFLSSGNPYTPPRMPDLRGIAENGDAEELDTALEMAVRAVPDNLGLTRKISDPEKSALSFALRRMAQSGMEPGLESLLLTLETLTEEAEADDSGKFTDSFNKATKRLLENFRTNGLGRPNLYRNGTADIRALLDPGLSRPRVTVVNLSLGGPSPERQRKMVQNILAAIYAMATTNHPRNMNGIIAIDEAKEFVPSKITVESKSIIIKLASMARKYGYGLILASQSVTSLDTQAINNFGTKFVGRHSSGAAVDAAEKFLDTDEDLRLSHLGKGQFYALSGSLHGPGSRSAKVRASMCLSCHPDNQPSPEAVIKIALDSAAIAEGRG
ncbi:MAG: DUF87 domain-containing protein [Deltaproteobacteria bacterium]|jgi:DNA helicase HerA-like ATPase|nr:DUF87 domain-containing protein [Deltaproteobacteria bacterium]